MMSADYMHQLKRQAANRSKREHVTPTILLDCHKDGRVKPSIPFIGERTWKRDWRVVDLNKLLPNVSAYRRGDFNDANIFFVDSSGWGAPDEMALTLDRFLQMAPAGFGYAVVEAGQFQVCVRAYLPPVALRSEEVRRLVREVANLTVENA